MHMLICEYDLDNADPSGWASDCNDPDNSSRVNPHADHEYFYGESFWQWCQRHAQDWTVNRDSNSIGWRLHEQILYIRQ